VSGHSSVFLCAGAVIANKLLTPFTDELREDLMVAIDTFHPLFGEGWQAAHFTKLFKSLSIGESHPMLNWSL